MSDSDLFRDQPILAGLDRRVGEMKIEDDYEYRNELRFKLYRDVLTQIRDMKRPDADAMMVLAALVLDEPNPTSWNVHLCPRCFHGLFRHEVDIGVGIPYGPWGCQSCHWSESPQYDRSRGPSRANKEQEHGPDRWTDEFGASHHRDREGPDPLYPGVSHAGNDKPTLEMTPEAVAEALKQDEEEL